MCINMYTRMLTSPAHHPMSMYRDQCGKLAPWIFLTNFYLPLGKQHSLLTSVFLHYDSDNHLLLLMCPFDLQPSFLFMIVRPNLQKNLLCSPCSRPHHLTLSSFCGSAHSFDMALLWPESIRAGLGIDPC